MGREKEHEEEIMTDTAGFHNVSYKSPSACI
jgi:hypothetical protein